MLRHRRVRRPQPLAPQPRGRHRYCRGRRHRPPVPNRPAHRRMRLHGMATPRPPLPGAAAYQSAVPSPPRPDAVSLAPIATPAPRPPIASAPPYAPPQARARAPAADGRRRPTASCRLRRPGRFFLARRRRRWAVVPAAPAPAPTGE
eukprot:scaffold7775_cov101-Isochrysis_galbana.AAC.1